MPLAEDGQQDVSLGDAPNRLFQAVTVAVAGMYELGWYDNTAVPPGPNTSPYSVDVSTIAGMVMFTNQYDAGHGGVWSNRSATVYLPTGQYSLAFTAHEPYGGWSTLIDNVSFKPLFSPPAILLQPPSQEAKTLFGLSFSVSALGTPPLEYQWQFKGTNLADSFRVSGSASNVLTIFGLTGADAGDYQVVITNVYGAVTSSPAALTFPVQSVLVPLQNATATASRSPDYPPSAAIDGSLTEDAGWSLPQGGQPAAIAFQTTEDLGYSGGTTLTFALRQGRSLGVYPNCHLGLFRLSVTTAERRTFADGLANGGNVGTNWNILVPTSFSATGGAALALQADSSLLATGTFDGTDTVYTITAQTMLTNITGFRLEALTNASLPRGGPGLSDSGNFVLQEFQVFAAPVVPGLPILLSDAASQEIAAGSNVVLQVVGAGAGPFTYQWQLDGTNLGVSEQISGSKTSTLTITNLTSGNVGYYEAVVTGPYGTVTSAPTALELAIPPNPDGVWLGLRKTTNSLLLALHSTKGVFFVTRGDTPTSLLYTGTVIYAAAASNGIAGTLALGDLSSPAQGFFTAFQYPGVSPDDLSEAISDEEDVGAEYYCRSATAIGPLVSDQPISLTLQIQNDMHELAPQTGVVSLSLIASNGEAPPFAYTIVPDRIPAIGGHASAAIVISCTNSLEGFLLAGDFQPATPQKEGLNGGPKCPHPIFLTFPDLLTYRDPDTTHWRYPLPTRFPIAGTFGEWPGHASIHWGVDISAPEGTPVFASKRGIVTHIGSIGKKNCDVVVVDHGNSFFTKYGHIIPLLLPGETVEAGDIVGLVGPKSYTTYSPHLHFGMSSVSVDPLSIPNYLPILGPFPGTELNPISSDGRLQFAPALVDVALDTGPPAFKAGTVVKWDPSTFDYDLPSRWGANANGQYEIQKGFLLVTVSDPDRGHQLMPEYIRLTPEDGAPQVIDYQSGKNAISNFVRHPAGSGCAQYTSSEYDGQRNKLLNTKATAYKYFCSWDTSAYADEPKGPRSMSVFVRDIAGRTASIMFSYGPQMRVLTQQNGDYLLEVSGYLGTNLGPAFVTVDAYELQISDPTGGAVFTSTGTGELVTPFYTAHLGKQNFMIHVPPSSNPLEVMVTASSRLLPNIRHRIALQGVVASIATSASVSVYSGYCPSGLCWRSMDQKGTAGFVPVSQLNPSYRSILGTGNGTEQPTRYDGLANPSVAVGRIKLVTAARFSDLSSSRVHRGDDAVVEAHAAVTTEYSGIVFQDATNSGQTASIPATLNLMFDFTDLEGSCPVSTLFGNSVAATARGSVGVRLNGALIASGSVTASWQPNVDQPQVTFTGFLKGSGALSIPFPGTVQLNTPYTLSLEMSSDSSTMYVTAMDSGWAGLQSVLAFPAGTPVFGLPSGFTVNAPAARIFNNIFTPSP